jgi:hypothetical protein
MKEKIINPKTKRRIVVGGIAYKRLIESGYKDINGELILIGKEITPEGYIANPITGKLIKKGGLAYKNVNKALIDNSLVPNMIKKDILEENNDELEPKVINQYIIDDNYKYNEIVHISDIHIPLKLYKDRMDEYYKVFEQLYSEIRENQVIVITGDLLHVKLLFESETINMARTFINRLGKNNKVLIITGNHDCSEINTHRADAIGAVIHELYNNNIFYLRDSGLYRLGNIVYVVSSLYDKIFIKSKHFKREDGLKYYALYHGTIDGGIGCNGRKLSNKNKTLADFDGFDAVLLGDVHKRQMLTSSIWYAGSLIQRNFGESIDGHGYLLWDTNKNTVIKEVDLNNDYGYINIDVYDELVIPEIGHIKYPRFKCKYHGTSIESKTKTELTLKDKYKNCIIENITGPILNNVLVDINKLDDIECIKSLCNPLLVDDVIKLHEYIKSNMKYEDTSTINEWNVLRLEFKNMFAYGGDKINIIDFISGINNICSPNMTGKTSIVNLIIYALTGSISSNRQNINYSNIMNKNATDGFIKLYVLINNVEHLITKHISKLSSKYAHETRIFKLDNNVYVNITETDKIKTIKLIKDMTNDYNEITSFNMIDNIHDSFINKNDKDKLLYFNRMSKVDIYEKCLQSAKLIKKPISKYHKENIRSVQNYVVDEDQHKKYLEQLSLDRSLLEEQLNLKKYNDIVTESEVKIKELVLLVKSIHISEYDGKYSKSELDDMMKSGITNDESIESLRTKISIMNTTYDQLTESINTIEKQFPSKGICTGTLKNIIREYTELEFEFKKLCSKYNITDSYIPNNIKLDLNDTRAKIRKLSIYLIGIPKGTPSYYTPKYSIDKYNMMQKEYDGIKLYNPNYIPDKSHSIVDIDTSDKFYNNCKYKYDGSNCNMSKDELMNKLSLARKVLGENVDVYKDLIQMDPTPYEIRRKVIIGIIGDTKPVERKIFKNTGKSYSDISLTRLIYVRNMLNEIVIDEYRVVDMNKFKYLTNLESKQLLVDIDKLIIDWNEGKRDKIILDKVNYVLNNFDDYSNQVQIKELDIIKNNIAFNNALRNKIIERGNLLDELNVIEYTHYKLYDELLLIDPLLDDCYKYEKRLEVNNLVDNINRLENAEHIKSIEEYRDYHNYARKITLGEVLRDESQANLLLLESLYNDIITYEKNNKYTELREKFVAGKLLSMSARNQLIAINQLEKLNVDRDRIGVLNSKLQYAIAREDMINMDKISIIKGYNDEILYHRDIIDKYSSVAKYDEELITKCNNSIAILTNRVSEYNVSKSKNNEIQVKYNENERQLMICNEYIKLFSPNEIPYKIIMNKAKLFENIINTVILDFISYKIKVDVSKNRMTLTFDGFGVEHLSGYEKLIARIAINQAVIVLGNCNRGKLLIMDESLDCIDSGRFNDDLPKLLNMIKKYYNTIILISHRFISDDIIDKNINIVRNNDYSIIKM